MQFTLCTNRLFGKYTAWTIDDQGSFFSSFTSTNASQEKFMNIVLKRNSLTQIWSRNGKNKDMKNYVACSACNQQTTNSKVHAFVGYLKRTSKKENFCNAKTADAEVAQALTDYIMRYYFFYFCLYLALKYSSKHLYSDVS